jgi:phosphoribosylamine-glycine ligase
LNLLYIDTDGVGLSYCFRAAMAGHAVRWFVEPKPSNSKDTGRGFKGIEKVDNWVPHVKWADLIISSSNDKYVEKLDFFRKQGFPVFGPTPESAKLEISRGDGMRLLEKHGIEVPPYKTFKTIQEAKKHVEKTEERFVFKTLGDNEDKALSYVGKSPADLIAWMDRLVETGNQPKGEVMLQEFIKGIEFGVSRFMGRDGFVGQYNECFEHKKLMPSNFGCNTGEMGTVASFVPDSKIGKETLGKLEEVIHKTRHTGDISLGFMVDEKGKAWPLEWTCRFGWPIANMMLGATEGDPIAWMKDALEGKDTTSFKEEIGVCAIIAHGDFPHGNVPKKELAGVPIYGVTRGNKKFIHPQSVKIDILPDMDGDKLVRRPLWNTSGDYVAVVTGFGRDVKQASSRCYKTIDQLHVSNMMVRDDIGEGLEKQLPKLHEFGYATHFEYDKGRE